MLRCVKTSILSLARQLCDERAESVARKWAERKERCTYCVQELH